ncbi:MAG: class I SAM-dependent methyltransferase [Saprospiraceae bacterium]|nr:class I SAM-dependent methyltransferase [Saprospiraceae bacterium]
MAFHFHQDRIIYFNQQVENAKDFVIPFITSVCPIPSQSRVLEIGCGEGGVLKAFVDHGCMGVGVELSEHKYQLAKEFLQDYTSNNTIKLLRKNIYDVDFYQEMDGLFDFIILKDVIEHIHDQQLIMEKLKTFLKPSGKIFLGFPPWQMPFGGHQQICNNKLLSILPYYHLLPTFVYKTILNWGGESKQIVDDLIEIKQTGISLERFERIVSATDYKITKKLFYLINPIYKYKFGLTPRRQFGFISKIPWLRNFVTTCAYYLLEQK